MTFIRRLRLALRFFQEIKIKDFTKLQNLQVRQLTAPTNEADIIYSCARQLLVSLLESAELQQQQPLVLRLMGVRYMKYFCFKMSLVLNIKLFFQIRTLRIYFINFRMSDLKNKNEIKSKQSSISSFFNQIKPVAAEVQDLSRTKENESVKDEESYLNLKEDKLYECPICLEYIDGLEKLNIHVDTCCSNSSNPTEFLGKPRFLQN